MDMGGSPLPLFAYDLFLVSTIITSSSRAQSKTMIDVSAFLPNIHSLTFLFTSQVLSSWLYSQTMYQALERIAFGGKLFGRKLFG